MFLARPFACTEEFQTSGIERNVCWPLIGTVPGRVFQTWGLPLRSISYDHRFSAANQSVPCRLAEGIVPEPPSLKHSRISTMKIRFLVGFVAFAICGCEGVDGALIRNGSTVVVNDEAYTVGPMSQGPNLYAARYNGAPVQSIHLGHAEGRISAIEAFTGCDVNPSSIAVLNGMVTTAAVDCG